MLNRSQARVLLIASLVFAIFMIGETVDFVTSPTYQVAEQAYHENQEAESTVEANGIYSALLSINYFFTVFEKLFIVIGTLAVALFTYRLWDSTAKLAEITSNLHEMAIKQENSTRTIERAYVKMSHHSPPGLEWAPFGEVVICRAHLNVKNYGSTPALVTRIHAEFVVSRADDRIPRSPLYRGPNTVMTSGTFLVKKDDFNAPIEGRIPANRLKKSTAPELARVLGCS